MRGTPIYEKETGTRDSGRRSETEAPPSRPGHTGFVFSSWPVKNITLLACTSICVGTLVTVGGINVYVFLARPYTC